MPKTFQLFVACLVFSTFAFLSGCRSTTTKLASVPGFGWMDRNEEGWAGYEPAPSLPRPSSASEPTGSDSDASNIASSAPATKTFPHLGGSPLTAPNRSDDIARFDPRYAKGATPSGGVKKNTASTYGDYASAYGKYGPPKSLSSATDAGVKPQQGPYRASPTPNYAKSLQGGSTQGYGASDGSEPASGDTWNSPDRSEVASTDRTSRFESPASASPANWSNDGRVADNDSGYVPPGFITKPKPSGLATVPNPQADPERSSSGTSRAAEYVASAPNAGLRPSTNLGSSVDNSASRFGSAGQQPANMPSVSGGSSDRFGASAGGEVVNDYVGSRAAATSPFAARGDELDASPANTLSSGSRFQSSEPFPRSASPSAPNGFAAAPTNGQNATTRNAPLGAADRFTTNPADRMAGTAEQTTANGYLDAIGGAAGASRQAASNYLSGETARDVGPLPRNTPAARSYPSTSTPHGYLETTPANSGSPNSSPSTIRRSSTPFRPGSTSSYQSSLRTTRKQQITMAGGHALPEADQLVLAVGDKFQFPRTLR